MSTSAIQAKLAELGITLPPLAVPAAAYQPFVRSGNLLFVSGHIAKKDGKPWVGQLGRDTDTATGQAAARAIAIMWDTPPSPQRSWRWWRAIRW